MSLWEGSRVPRMYTDYTKSFGKTEQTRANHRAATRRFFALCGSALRVSGVIYRDVPWLSGSLSRAHRNGWPFDATTASRSTDVWHRSSGSPFVVLWNGQGVFSNLRWIQWPTGRQFNEISRWLARQEIFCTWNVAAFIMCEICTSTNMLGCGWIWWLMVSSV